MNKDQWISVNDRLPKEIDGESRAVLGIVRTIFGHAEYIDHYQIVWCEHKEWHTSPRGKVLYWMPLPEPPENKDNSGEWNEPELSKR